MNYEIKVGDSTTFTVSNVMNQTKKKRKRK